MIHKPPLSDKKPPSITIDMASRRNGRRFAIVSGVLSQMGLHHTARFGPWRRFRLEGLEAKAVGSNYCTLAGRKAEPAEVLITDNPNAKHHGKLIRIDYDFQARLDQDTDDKTLFLPILFHPDLLNDRAYDEAEALAKNTRRSIGILFAGNCDPATYNNPAIEKKYGLLNRTSLMRLAEQLPASRMFFPESREAFEQAREKGDLTDRFVWIDTNRFRIPQKEWLGLVGDAHYFFCTPGVHYPYCQNLNEAMACGTVPILQYPDYYRPALVDRENAVTFRNEGDLGKTLAGIFGDQIRSHWVGMSSAAREYHAQHLSLTHAMSEIAEFLGDPDRSSLTWVLAGKS